MKKLELPDKLLLVTPQTKLLRKGGGFIRGQCENLNAAKYNIYIYSGQKQQTFNINKSSEHQPPKFTFSRNWKYYTQLEDGSYAETIVTVDEAEISEEVSGDDLEDETVTAHQRIMRTAKKPARVIILSDFVSHAKSV